MGSSSASRAYRFSVSGVVYGIAASVAEAEEIEEFSPVVAESVE
jgi:hypothetical protein